MRFEHLEVAGWGPATRPSTLGGDANNVSFDDLHVHDVDNGFLAARRARRRTT